MTVTPSRGARRILVGLLVLAGLARSLAVCLRLPPDPDMATPTVVFRQVCADGIGALAAWHATQDNWLLSVIVPSLPLGLVFGTPQALPAVIGWLFFVAAAALASLLARPHAGPTAAALLGAVLLFASPDALLGTGSLAHPASHDATIAWSLGALLAADRFLRRPRARALLPFVGCLLVATVSDPWGRAAFLAPSTAASFLLATGAGAGAARRRALLLAGATLPVWLAGGHGFGLLPFLPGARLDRGPVSGWPAHATTVVAGLGRLLDLVPDGGGDVGAFASVVVLVAAALGGVARAIRGRTGDTAVALFLPVVAVLSIGATVVAFAVSRIAVAPDTARLVANGYVLLPLAILVATRRASPRVPALLAVLAAAFVVSGLVAPEPASLRAARAARARDGALFGFLEANGLAHGYGPYWASGANAASLRTGGRVVIRPVAAPTPRGPIGPRDGQVFDAWYRAGGFGADATGTRFLVAAPDPELCADIDACRRLALRSFGPPDRTLDWRGVPVLVWSHEVMGAPPSAAVMASLPRVEAGADAPSGPALAPFLWTGWTAPAADGAWTTGRVSTLIVRVPPRASRLCLRVRASGRPGGTVPVRVDGGNVAAVTLDVPRDRPARLCVPVPAGPVATVTLAREAAHYENDRLIPGVLLAAISFR